MSTILACLKVDNKFQKMAIMGYKLPSKGYDIFISSKM